MWVWKLNRMDGCVGRCGMVMCSDSFQKLKSNTNTEVTQSSEFVAPCLT